MIDKENTSRIVSEISQVKEEKYKKLIRDNYCHIKAKTIHQHLGRLSQLFISIGALENALIEDWNNREGLYRTPYLQISEEDLLLHILGNPQILKEPELGLLVDLIQLERGVLKSRSV